MLVEAFLGGGGCRVVVGAQAELEVTLMVGRKLHAQLDGRPLFPGGRYDPKAVLATPFVRARLGKKILL